MPQVPANGITVAYDVAGDPAAAPLLLVSGLGTQLTGWDDGFLDALVERDLFVIRFDNRDVGHSTWFGDAGRPDPFAVAAGQPPPYRLADMAADAAGLIEALGRAAVLGRPAVHVLGISMGGMIAQELAIGHPHLVQSLVSVMSTTGDTAVGQPSDAAVGVLLAPAPTSRAEAAERSVELHRVIGSPGWPPDDAAVRARALVAYDRAFNPDGTIRQVCAILGSPDRTARLREVTAPTLVIHGTADPLVDPSGGDATAAAIPGARLWRIEGMGHDVPAALVDGVADAIAAHVHTHDRV